MEQIEKDILLLKAKTPFSCIGNSVPTDGLVRQGSRVSVATSVVSYKGGFRGGHFSKYNFFITILYK